MNRDKEVKIRLTQQEKDKLKLKAGKLSLSKYMRDVSLGHDLDNCVIQVSDPALVRQISAIGNLLNQALRAANYQVKAGYPLDSARLNVAIKSAQRALEGLSHAS
jgi:hypothetical protein